MSINRREFLLGTVAGLVLPRFFDKVFSFVENHEEPLLWAPKSATIEMYAVQEWAADYGAYQLNIGDIHAEPPGQMTVREFCTRFAQGDPEQWWQEGWNMGDEDAPVPWDEMVGEQTVFDFWVAAESTSSRASRYIESIDLGPRLAGAESVGELRLEIGGPCSDLWSYEAVDDVSLSLLQNRLNEINSGMKIVVV